MARLLAVSSLLFLSISSAHAQPKTIRVPQDHATIQAAIDAAVHGDTVLVAEGTYVENIRYRGKKIMVASLFLVDRDTSHISRTVIDGSSPAHPDTAATVWFTETDTTSVLMGFTITRGKGILSRYSWAPTDWVEGGGIRVGRTGFFAGGAKILHNIIRDNSLTGGQFVSSIPWVSGAAIAVSDVAGLTIIRNNIIRRNSVSGASEFTAVCIYNSKAVVEGNLFEDNVGNATTGSSSNALSVIGSWSSLWEGRTTGRDSIWIRDNVIRNNSYNGGGAIGVHGDSLYASIERNLVHNNAAIDGTVLILTTQQARANIVGNQFLSNSGTGFQVWTTSKAVANFYDNIFSGNWISGAGSTNSTIYYGNASGVLANNVITHNTSRGSSIGIWAYSDVTLDGNIITDNDNRISVLRISGTSTTATVRNNVVARNRAMSLPWLGGAARVSSGARAWFIHNTITENQVDSVGGIYVDSTAIVYLVNNILWNDSTYRPASGHEVGIETATLPDNAARVFASKNVVPGYGGDNYSFDPVFAPGDSNYTLSRTSPAIGAGVLSASLAAGTAYAWDFNALTHDRSQGPRPNPAGSMPDLGATESPYATSSAVLRAIAPADFVLDQNYPNPFNPETKIGYRMKERGYVEVSVMNILGQRVAVLVEGMREAGYHQAVFGKEYGVGRLSSGVYFYRMSVRAENGERFESVRKMVMIK